MACGCYNKSYRGRGCVFSSRLFQHLSGSSQHSIGHYKCDTCYIVMRRNGYGFIFYIANNIISMSMWILLVINNHDLTQIITFFNYITYFMLNVRGVFNFAKLKKQQNSELEDASFDKIMKILKEN